MIFQGTLSEGKDRIANIFENKIFHFKHFYQNIQSYQPKIQPRKPFKDMCHQDEHKQVGVVLQVSQFFLHRPSA